MRESRPGRNPSMKIATAIAAVGALGAAVTILILIVFAIAAAFGNGALANLIWVGFVWLGVFAALTIAGGMRWFHLSDMQEENREL